MMKGLHSFVFLAMSTTHVLIWKVLVNYNIQELLIDIYKQGKEIVMNVKYSFLTDFSKINTYLLYV